MGKQLFKALCGSRGSLILPQVMSRESASIGGEDYMFEIKKKTGKVSKITISA